MKVGYRDVDGYEQTAYLDEPEVARDIYRGVHKHTDEPVTVRWTGTEWVEMTTDPLWWRIRGTSGPDPMDPDYLRVRVEVKPHTDVLGCAVRLEPRHTPQDYKDALDRLVWELDKLLGG